MRNLQEATERICELKGALVALDALLPAVIDTLSAAGLHRLTASFDAHAEVARTLMLNSEMSDVVLAAFEREVARNGALLRRGLTAGPHMPPVPGLDPLLLTTTRVSSFLGTTCLLQDSGFFFRRNEQLFLVSTRQAMAGRDGTPPPDRIEIELPATPQGQVRHTWCLPTLRHDNQRRWRDMPDDASPIDVAVMPLEPSELPASALLLAFDASHLEAHGEDIGVGDIVSMVGFPLDLPLDAQPLPIAIARSGSIASSYGSRFQDGLTFLTDMHSHPGSGGSPIVRRRTVSRAASAPAGWQLIGVHSSAPITSKSGPCPDFHRAWYADILLTLTNER